jgi:hypothetical protein
MRVAYLAIQCTAATGERGTFLYHGNMVAVSPVFPAGCIPCFEWCKANGWTQAPYDPSHPVGVYTAPDVSDGIDVTPHPVTPRN